MRHSYLTAKQIQYLKPGASRREVPCGPPAGLYCIVQVSGKKSFALRYRFNREPRKMTFGKPYPELSLAAARAEAEAALENLGRGIDPTEAKAQEEGRAPESIRAVAEEWLARDVSRTRTYIEVRRVVRREIIQPWKHKLVTEIRKPDVLRLLDAIVDRGAPIQANRVRSLLLRLFRWCADERGYFEDSPSPVANVRPRVKEKSRDRVLSEDELAQVWKATEAIQYPYGPYLRIVILTAQRRGEVAAMRSEDLDFKKSIWTLPAESTKPGRMHDVPLSGPALEILKQLPRSKGPYLFSTKDGEMPINGFARWKHALDAAILSNGADNVAGWTVHDLRRTAATWMAGAGVPPHVLSAILNHAPGSSQGVTSIYNRFRYVEERRAALEQWGQHVRELAGKREEERKAVAG